MIRHFTIDKLLKGKHTFPLAVCVLATVLASCTTAQKQAGLPDDSQELVALLPSADEQAQTASTPRDPYVVSMANNQQGQNLSIGASSQPNLQSADGEIPVDSASEDGTALGIMQSTRVKANAGSIFSNVTAASNSNAPSFASVKPVKASLFSAAPIVTTDQLTSTPDNDIIVPPATTAAADPTNDSDYDAGIVVLNRQTDEQRRIMAENNDLSKNANPQIRAMEPDFNAAPANDPAMPRKPAKKRWSLIDMFGDLGKSAGKGKNTASK